MELPDSSCNECNPKTNKLDTHVANRIMHRFRHHNGIQSRTRSNTDTARVSFFGVNGAIRTVEVPFDEAPHLMHLPVYSLPGLVRGVDESDDCTPEDLFIWLANDVGQKVARLRLSDDEQLATPLEADWPRFCRFLAKLALANTVALLGYDSRKSFLPDVILGTNPSVRHFVGGDGVFVAPGTRETVTANPTEAIATFRYVRCEFPNLPDVLIADISLFGNAETPHYQVCIGPIGDLDINATELRLQP